MSTFDLFSSYNEENQDFNPAVKPMGRRAGRAVEKKKRRGRTTSKKGSDDSDEDYLEPDEEITNDLPLLVEPEKSRPIEQDLFAEQEILTEKTESEKSPEPIVNEVIVPIEDESNTVKERTNPEEDDQANQDGISRIEVVDEQFNQAENEEIVESEQETQQVFEDVSLSSDSHKLEPEFETPQIEAIQSDSNRTDDSIEIEITEEKPIEQPKKPSFGLAKVLQKKEEPEEIEVSPSLIEQNEAVEPESQSSPINPIITLSKVVEEVSAETEMQESTAEQRNLDSTNESEESELSDEVIQTQPIQTEVVSPTDIEETTISIQDDGNEAESSPTEMNDDIDAFLDELSSEISAADEDVKVEPLDQTDSNEFLLTSKKVAEADSDTVNIPIETQETHSLPEEKTIEIESKEPQENPLISEIQPPIEEEKPKKRSFFNLNKLLSTQKEEKPEDVVESKNEVIEPAKVVEEKEITQQFPEINVEDSQNSEQNESIVDDELDEFVESMDAVASVNDKPEFDSVNEEVLQTDIPDSTEVVEPVEEMISKFEEHKSEVIEPEMISLDSNEKEEPVTVESPIENKTELSEPIDEDEPRKVVLPGLGSLRKRLNPIKPRKMPFQMPVLPKRDDDEKGDSDEQSNSLETEKEESKPIETKATELINKEINLSKPFSETELNEIEVPEEILDEILEEVDSISTQTEKTEEKKQDPVVPQPIKSINTDEVDESIIDEIDDLIASVETDESEMDEEPSDLITVAELLKSETKPSIPFNQESDEAIDEIISDLADSLFTTEQNSTVDEGTEKRISEKNPSSTVNQEDLKSSDEDFVVDDVDFSDLFEHLIEDALDDTTPIASDSNESESTQDEEEFSFEHAMEQIDKSIEQIDNFSENTEPEIKEASKDSNGKPSKKDSSSDENVSLAELLNREIAKQREQAESEQDHIAEEKQKHSDEDDIFSVRKVNQEELNVTDEVDSILNDINFLDESSDEISEVNTADSTTEVENETGDLLPQDEPDWYTEILSGLEKSPKSLHEEINTQEDQEVEEMEFPEVEEAKSESKVNVESSDENQEEESVFDSIIENLFDDSEVGSDADSDSSTVPKQDEEGFNTKRKTEIPIYVSSSIRNKSNESQLKKSRGKFAKKTSSADNGDQLPLPDFDPLAVYKGMIRRWFIINRHTIGLFSGGLVAFRNALPKSRTRGMKFGFTRMAAAIIKPFLAKEIRDKSFAVQLRRRLELMGPTYIKLGQILALREDILPETVTEELKNLLDRLPQIPFADIKAIIEAELEVPLETCFKDINRSPIGTASIAQTHFATTVDDERVVLKVVKPGIRDSILTDIRLLKLISGFLQWAIPQYQPKMLIDEFCAYTEKEVDLTNEADHAEIFAANFTEMEGVRFPKIYREYSGADVLCMEFMDGYKPGAPQMEELSKEQREYLVDRGAASIIQMLYKDGFFHADLHPGNLMILKGPELGFIDLGMVGRFEDKTRRRMLYYFHALVTGDIDGATKYLLAMAKVGEGGDPQGFRRAVADVLRRYYMHSQSGDFSLGKLILSSLSLGGKYRVFFPVEMTLMVKALVTFEGVGYMLVPRLDVPALSEKYVSKIFKDQFNPKAITHELMRGTPELVDMLVQLPKISADGLKFLEEFMNDRTPTNPLEGVKSAIIAGSLLVGGVIAFVQDAHMGVYLSLLGLSGLIALFGK